MEKMTNSKALAFVLANATLPTDVREKIENIKASIDKKNSAERKPTATQTENVGFKEAIVNGMEVGKDYTIGELMKCIPAIADLTNQRVSAIVRQLKEDGVLVRKEIKRKAYFSLATVNNKDGEAVDGE